MKQIYFVIYVASILFVGTTVDAQIVFQRRPNDRVVAQPTPPPPPQQGPIVQNNVPTDRVVEQRSRSDRSAQRSIPTDRVTEQPQFPNLPDMRRPMKTPPYIFASPSTVVVKSGENFGYAVLMWDGGPNHQYAEVWQKVDDGDAQFLLEKGKGETGAKIELGKTYTFILTDFGETLDTVTVTAQRDPKDSPIGMPNRPGRDIEANMMTYVSDVGSEAKSKTVEITFFAASNADPVVEIGTARPIQSGGRWVFPQGTMVGSGSATPGGMKKVGTKLNTFHKFSSYLPGFPELQPSTLYWYIINVRNPDFQTTGQFSTSVERIGVRVVFESILIIDDTDDLSAGDISVWGWVNEGDSSGTSFVRGRGGMNSGESYPLNKVIIIKSAPDLLTLAVSANDDDGLFDRFDTDNTPGSINGCYNNKDGLDGNSARDQWDLTRFPTAKNEVYRVPFKIKSNGKCNLQFEVSGYWEITRAN